MLRGTRVVYHLVFLISLSIGYVHTLPLQVLPSIPGYIPVYIRHGDQPLEEINPALAEAFHEEARLSKNTESDNIFVPVEIALLEVETNKNNIEPVTPLTVEENSHDRKASPSEVPDNSHHKSNEATLSVVTETNKIIVDLLNQPNLRPINTQSDTHEEISELGIANEELPNKEQYLADTLPNVQKLLLSTEKILEPEKERTENY